MAIPTTPKGPEDNDNTGPKSETSDVEMEDDEHEKPVTPRKNKPGNLDPKTPPTPAKPFMNMRLSDLDRARLVADGKAVWATIDGALPRRGSTYRKLFSFLTEKAGKGVTKIISSASSYYAIIYETQARRDSGLKRLREAKFEVDGTQIELQLSKFGDIGGTGPYTYVTSGGPMDTPQDIQAAINSRFKDKGSAGSGSS
ncbi:hypothetical protein, variant 2 [Blastomyces dermatitidis ATCC 26199]|nr:hypothetical protein BDFG_09400 [Blastomyces dermatitidis ATCC 26199]EQL27799.1 hypothetical protein, variant 1 [Blastomyces dermatitidis ATCC 26199]EQL27800.1 hypothetical protein, variant 2 [Blastomyces dermatitidis ATCC 26199]